MSEVRANTISDAAGTGPVTLTKQSAAKAWSNLNGVGTITLRDSFNIASVTDNGTGDYTYNFSSAMGNIVYGQVTDGIGAGVIYLHTGNNASAQTGSIRPGVTYSWSGGSAASASTGDFGNAYLTLHGDLA